MIKIPMGYHTYEKMNECIKITFQLENKLSFAYLFKDNNVSKADFDNF